MDKAVKKIELIEWLTRLQDESLIERVEALRKGTVKVSYKARTPGSLDELQKRIDRSEEDVAAGRVHSQEAVEAHFKSKFGK